MNAPDRTVVVRRLRRHRSRADPARRRSSRGRLECLDRERERHLGRRRQGPSPGRAVSRQDSARVWPRRSRRRWSSALPAWSRIRFIPPSCRCAPQPVASWSTTSRSARSANGPTCVACCRSSTLPSSAGRERILRERQNARYDAVVGSAPDTILTLDAEGTIQLVNPAAARQFGYSPDELIGHPLSSFLANPRRVERCLQGRPRRRSAAAAPSSSRRGARTARPAISRRRHRDGRAKAGPSSPRSCATSTSGAWPSMRCAC